MSNLISIMIIRLRMFMKIKYKSKYITNIQKYVNKYIGNLQDMYDMIYIFIFICYNLNYNKLL